MLRSLERHSGTLICIRQARTSYGGTSPAELAFESEDGLFSNVGLERGAFLRALAAGGLGGAGTWAISAVLLGSVVYFPFWLGLYLMLGIFAGTLAGVLAIFGVRQTRLGCLWRGGSAIVLFGVSAASWFGIEAGPRAIVFVWWIVVSVALFLLELVLARRQPYDGSRRNARV